MHAQLVLEKANRLGCTKGAEALKAIVQWFVDNNKDIDFSIYRSIASLPDDEFVQFIYAMEKVPLADEQLNQLIKLRQIGR